MKIRVLMLLFLVIISCDNATNNSVEQRQIVADSTKLNKAFIKPNNKVLKSQLAFDKLSRIIISTFKIQKLQAKKVYKPLEMEFYTLIDATKVKQFNNYSNFFIIEFENSSDAKNEFKKIKTVARKSLNNRKALFDYHRVFDKGGISFNNVDKWIVGHQLRCNMYQSDYETDKKFTSELEKIDIQVDWVRFYCGWGNIKIKALR